MRRGSRGRGYGRPPQHHHQNQGRPSPSSTGLMTSHIQGLKDIDMELELLKRKREIIEQQQQIMSSNYRQKNDYEQPLFNESRDNNRYDDYVRLYDNPHEAEPYVGGSSARKRAHIPVWESESPPKRFAAPTQHSVREVGVKNTFGSRLGPPAQAMRPDYQPRSSAPQPYKRPYQFAPPQKRKEFNPTKVTKHSSGPPPSKFANYQPPSERKKFVGQALANSQVTVRPVRAPPAEKAAAWVLRADCEPSRQVAGRLELALGAIVKDIKLANPQYEELFKGSIASRTMKQAIRERVRAVMMGKPVLNTDAVKAAYYETYPQADGNDILMKGLEAQTCSEFIEVKSDDPEVYFKKNMYKLMSLKLDQMIDRLEKLYMGKNPGFAPRKRHRPQGKGNSQNEQSKAEIELDQTDGTDVIIKTEEASETDDTKMKTEVTSDSFDQASGNTNDGTEESNKQPDEESNKETPKLANNAHLVSLKQYQVFDKLMNAKMMPLLKKYAPKFLNLMDVDAMYRKTKASILNETKKKLGVIPEFHTDITQDNTNESKPIEKRFLTPLKYYVKIVGKPALPKRKAMESFFAEFKPKSVKKHRTIYNLLFVGFADKEPYDKILAADGTVIGKSTLDIKISERNDNKKNQNDSIVNVDANDDKQNEQKLFDSGSEVIGSDLDEQITDLLSSIRRSEQLDNSDVISESNNDENIKVENEEVELIEQEPNGAQNDEKEDASTEQDEDVVEIKDVPPKGDDIIEIRDDQGASVEKTDESESKEVKSDENENNDVIVVESEANGAGTGENNDNEANESENNEPKAAENDNNEIKTAEIQKNEETVTEKAEKSDKVTALKTEVSAKGTPTRSSARLATPSGIRTRRMSKLE